MTLLPPKIRSQLPGLRGTEKHEDPIAYLRLEARWLGWSWYILGFDGDDILYGYACTTHCRLGHFNLAELRSLRGPFWQPVKRDPKFRPLPLSAVRAGLK